MYNEFVSVKFIPVKFGFVRGVDKRQGCEPSIPSIEATRAWSAEARDWHLSVFINSRNSRISLVRRDTGSVLPKDLILAVSVKSCICDRECECVWLC